MFLRYDGYECFGFREPVQGTETILRREGERILRYSAGAECKSPVQDTAQMEGEGNRCSLRGLEKDREFQGGTALQPSYSPGLAYSLEQREDNLYPSYSIR